MSMAAIAAAAIFVAVFALILSMQFRTTERADLSRGRIARATGDPSAVGFSTTASILALRNRTMSTNVSMDRFLRSVHIAQTIDNKLVRSDWHMKVGDFFLISGGLGFLTFLILFLALHSPIPGLIGGIIVLFIPYLLLSRNVSRRRSRFDTQLIEFLTSVASALRAGSGLVQAITQVTDQAKPPISTEFRQTIYDTQVGANLEDALNSLNLRIGSPDLDMAITAIIIQRQTGGNLAEILMNLTTTMRERVRIRGEIATLTAQQKMTGFVVGLLPVGMFVALLLINKPYISLLFSTTLGYGMLGLYVLMQAVGFYVIMKVLDIEY